MLNRPATLRPHQDRLLPSDAAVRQLARRLYESVRDLPIVSPHGHVDARLLLDDQPFADPASLLVVPDHYVTRLLHAQGVPLEQLGVGQGVASADQSREIWRMLCAHWRAFRGTPVRYWLESELAEIFEVTVRPSADTADAIYDQIAARLADDDCRPRALFRRFGIDVLTTTDDPCDSLAAHQTLAQDQSWAARVLPTFRPDAYLDPASPHWSDLVQRLGEVAGTDTGHYRGYLAALEARRRHFIANGAVSADHGHVDLGTEPLAPADAARIFDRALGGKASGEETTAFRRHMLFEMARMSTEDGLVMTLHPGVCRNHHGPTFEKFGGDTGHDIPVRTEYTRALRPLLNQFGTHPNLHLVLFTVDETVFSREIAPLAGFYASVYIGAPWWFLDAPAAIRRFQRAVIETAGFSRLSGFIDDTRAFCSIPARHDMSRRLDSGLLAELVAEHQLDEDEAFTTLTELVTDNPRRVFKL
jgi:glucuronate isomerase